MTLLHLKKSITSLLTISALPKACILTSPQCLHLSPSQVFQYSTKLLTLSYRTLFATGLKFHIFWTLTSPQGPFTTACFKRMHCWNSSAFSIVLNKSLTTGSLRYAWRQADIVPTHKKGSKTDKENYGQISLTSIACKVCEKILKQRVINFWQDLGVLNEIQFGFLEAKSTVTQLPLLTSYFSISLKRSIQSLRCACWLWNRGQPVALV